MTIDAKMLSNGALRDRHMAPMVHTGTRTTYTKASTEYSGSSFHHSSEPHVSASGNSYSQSEA